MLESPKEVSMKKAITYAKFVAALIALIVAYKVYMGLGRTVMDRGDDSMEPAVRPGQWVWYNKTERHASQLKKGDIIVFRHPEKPIDSYVARVKGRPGETAGDLLLPRGYVWVLLDNKRKEPDSRTFGPLHEHFIAGKVIWLKGRLPLD